VEHDVKPTSTNQSFADRLREPARELAASARAAERAETPPG